MFLYGKKSKVQTHTLFNHISKTLMTFWSRPEYVSLLMSKNRRGTLKRGPGAYQTCAVFWAWIKARKMPKYHLLWINHELPSTPILCLHITAIVLYLLADLLSSSSHTKLSSFKAAHVALELRGGILAIILHSSYWRAESLREGSLLFLCAPLCLDDSWSPDKLRKESRARRLSQEKVTLR